MIREVKPAHNPVQLRPAPILVHRPEDGLHRLRDLAVLRLLASRLHEDAVAYSVDTPPVVEVAATEHLGFDALPVRCSRLVSRSSSTSTLPNTKSGHTTYYY